jgi:hypothetical protein
LQGTRLLRVCPCCGLVEDKAFDLNLEQKTLAEPCPKCNFTFPVMSPTPSSFAVFKDIVLAPETPAPAEIKSTVPA